MPEDKKITLEEVAKHKDQATGVWMVIHNSVYDVTKFVSEHPGGEEAMYEHAGKDATYAFEDVGHSVDARELLEEYKIGELADGDKEAKSSDSTTKTDAVPCYRRIKWFPCLAPVALALVATLGFRLYVALQKR